MNHPITTLLLAVLCVTPISAGETTVEKRPFTIRKSFEAAVLPESGAVLLNLEAESWPEFKITKLAAHGSLVTEGQTLVAFDAEAIDLKIADLKRALARTKLSIESAEAALQHLEQTTPHRLEAAKLEAEIAKEENTYFTTVRRKAEEESSHQMLERKKQMLQNQQEELRQLKQMYLADDLTEDTEEIILTRQQDNVNAAEFAVRMATLSHNRAIEVALPREATALTNKERDTAIKLNQLKTDAPRSIKTKQFELEELKVSLQRDTKTLAELQGDRALFEIKAPGDGIFYHGPIRDGRWSPADAGKSLVIHGSPALNRPFATFLPTTTPLALVAFLDEPIALSLQPGLKGTASQKGREDLETEVQISSLANAPGPDGRYRADLMGSWGEKPFAAIGSKLTVHVIAYHHDEAIVIPSAALRYDPQGWTAEVKLADGKSERRVVKRGRVSGEETEILSGLETGQVVLMAD